MKNYKLYIVPIILIVAILFSNCSITKRNCRSGYYVTWNKKSFDQEKITLLSKQRINLDKPLIVSAQKMENSLLKRKAIKPLRLNPDTCGDLIVMLNGEEKVGKIMEINPKLIRYKKCNTIHDTLETITIEEIFMVKYTNGTKELFKKSELKNRSNVSTKIVNTETKNVAPLKYNKFAIASFATALLSVTVYLSPIPLILGIIGSNQINKNPNKFKGTFMANVGMVLGIIGTIVLLFYRPFS
jgi:hypothetical protein